VKSELKLSYRLTVLSKPIISSADACQFFRKVWSRELINLQEEFYLLFLNQNNEVISWRHINTGTSKTCEIDIKMALACSLLCMASNVIIAHNHPSGNVKPSKDDLFITNKLFRALDMLDIKLLDHLIISQNSFFSFIDNDIKIA
jgi:DNA repair protein RadC